MTYPPDDPSQQPPQQPDFPPPPPPPQQQPPAFPPPQGFPPPPQQPSYPPPPPGGQGYPPPQGGQAYPPAPGAPAYPPAGSPVYGYGQGAGGVPPGMFFDPQSGLVLPAGTQLAPVGRRIGAWFLAIPLAVVTLGIGYLIWGLIVWGRGQTPALQVLGMRVWRPETQRNASWGYMALREIIGRFVEGILSIITLLISFILMLTGKERKTIHDMIAGTVVLHDPNKALAS
jgi:uncharacterized RDD family membrane protein YckC